MAKVTEAIGITGNEVAAMEEGREEGDEKAHREFLARRFPKHWHDAFLVHPPGSVKVDNARTMCGFSPEQWTIAERLISEGFVLGLSADPEEAVDATADLVSRFKIGVRAVYHPDDDVVYFIRDAAGKARAKKK